MKLQEGFNFDQAAADEDDGMEELTLDIAAKAKYTYTKRGREIGFLKVLKKLLGTGLWRKLTQNANKCECEHWECDGTQFLTMHRGLCISAPNVSKFDLRQAGNSQNDEFKKAMGQKGWQAFALKEAEPETQDEASIMTKYMDDGKHQYIYAKAELAMYIIYEYAVAPGNIQMDLMFIMSVPDYEQQVSRFNCTLDKVR